MSTTAALIAVCLALVGLAIVFALTIARPREGTPRRAHAVARPGIAAQARSARNRRPTSDLPPRHGSVSTDAGPPDEGTSPAIGRGA